MKQAMDSAVSISKTEQIGIPLGKSYFKPTPKFWRVFGDALMSLGALGTALNIHNPTVAIVCTVAGWLGKVITNSISSK